MFDADIAYPLLKTRTLAAAAAQVIESPREFVPHIGFDSKKNALRIATLANHTRNNAKKRPFCVTSAAVLRKPLRPG